MYPHLPIIETVQPTMRMKLCKWDGTFTGWCVHMLGYSAMMVKVWYDHGSGRRRRQGRKSRDRKCGVIYLLLTIKSGDFSATEKNLFKLILPKMSSGF